MSFEISILNNKKILNTSESFTINELFASNPSLRKYESYALAKCFFSADAFVLVDFLTVIDKPCKIEFLKLNDPLCNQAIQNSYAIILGYCLHNYFLNFKFVDYKRDEKAFFLEFFLPQPFLKPDLLIITEKMQVLIKNFTTSIEKITVSLSNAQKLFAKNQYVSNKLKDFLVNKEITIIKVGDFNFLNDQLIISFSKLTNSFKLLSNSSSYYLGNKDNQLLQRIYATAFANKKLLSEHLKDLQVRKESDHRYLNQQLKYFFTDDMIGRGLPVWLPHGTIVKQQITNFLHDLEVADGYFHVETPILGSLDLYKASGHYAHYHESMFPVVEIEDHEKLCLRPMTCPHHCIAFNHMVSSYKQLPFKLAENSLLFRYEPSGSLSGIERARSMCLNDAHIFIDSSQLKSEFLKTLKLIEKVLKRFQVKISYYRLSLRDANDKGKYYDDDIMWDNAENLLKELLIKHQAKFETATGEAAFYGPKLDIQIKNSLGHDVTLATVQLDFLLAKRLNLTYLDEKQRSQHPILIHRSLIGTFERFIATILEQYKGVMPLWLAPIQVAIIPLNNEAHLPYCNQLVKNLNNHHFRVLLDSSNNRLNYKIRTHQTAKINFLLIIGDNEVKSNTVSFRLYQQKNTNNLPVDEFFSLLKKELEN